MNSILKITLLMTLITSCHKISAEKTSHKIYSIYKPNDKRDENAINKTSIFKYETHSAQISTENGDSKKLETYLEEANFYNQKGDFVMSLKKINEGADLAKKNEAYNMLCRLLLVYQDSLLKMGYVKESNQALKNCETYNQLVRRKEDKQINTIYLLLAKANLMVDRNGLAKDMKSVIALKKKAYGEAIKLNESDKNNAIILIHVLESLSWSLPLSKNLPEAKKYTEQTDVLLRKYPDEYLIIQNLIIKGAIENIAKNYPAAIHYFSEVISRAKKIKNSYKLNEIYPMISASYGELDDFENATLYSWKYAHLSDSIDRVNEMTGNINLINTINKKVTPENKKIDTGIIIAIVAAILAIFLGILFYINRKTAGKKNMDSQNNSIPETSRENETETEESTAKKLTSLAKEDINAFYIEFRKAYPNFHQSLQEKYPDLNVADLNFCSLIKMQFEIKEISMYSDASLRSVESRRYRIIRKMNLKNQNELYMTIAAIE